MGSTYKGLTSRFLFRRRPPSKKEMEKFWADSRENDKEVNEYFSRLNERVFALPLLGTIGRYEDSVRLAVGAEASTALFGLFRDAPVSFCYAVEVDEAPRIRERRFSPLTATETEPTLGVVLCTLNYDPPKPSRIFLNFECGTESWSRCHPATPIW